MREVESQTHCSQGQKGSIVAVWEQTEVTGSTPLFLETQQKGAPLFLECSWKANALSTVALQLPGSPASWQPLFLLSIPQELGFSLALMESGMRLSSALTLTLSFCPHPIAVFSCIWGTSGGSP